jgi:hypothetical protein
MATTEVEVQAFRSMLLSEINGEKSGAQSALPDFAENIFTDKCTEWLSEAGLTENPEVCHFDQTFGGRPAKVSGYAVSDDEATIDLFVACFDGTDEGRTFAPDEFRRAARQARTFFSKVTSELLSSLNAGTGDFDMVDRLLKASGTVSRIRIFVISDCICSLVSLEDEELDGRQLIYEIIDVSRLHRLTQAGLPRDEIVVDFTEFASEGLRCLHAPEISPDYDAYLALIPGEILYSLYDRYGPLLLERNVRSFLQARGKVNRGIRDTLRKAPDRFMAYNNGIVATVDEIEVVQDETGSRCIVSVRGLQIVNGGQTTASIHRARRDDKVDLSSVYVAAKISLISEARIDEIVPSISLYANSQNNIQMADFSANHPYHVEMARLSTTVWCPGQQDRWFYERTRGGYEVEKSRTATTAAQLKRFNERTPRNQKFDKVELAKFVLSWDQRPDKVSLGGQKCFSWFMQNLTETHSKEWLPGETDYKRTVAKGIIYKEAMRITRQEGFPAYRPQIATYLMSYLSHRTGRQVDLDQIWENQGLSDDLVDLLRDWSHQIRDLIMETAGARNVGEWCKKEECWKAIRPKSLALPDELPCEIHGAGGNGRGEKAVSPSNLSPAELDAIHRCQGIGAQQWIAISQWGSESGILQDWQCGIAGTLGTYAARDWARAPSAKQARHGVEILNLAEQEGGPLSGAGSSD